MKLQLKNDIVIMSVILYLEHVETIDILYYRDQNKLIEYGSSRVVVEFAL